MVSSAKPKLRKVESKTKEFILFLPRRSNFAIEDSKVTKKWAKHQIICVIGYTVTAVTILPPEIKDLTVLNA
jgi:hypothetical protein